MSSVPQDGEVPSTPIDWLVGALDAFALFLSWIGMWVFVPILGVLVCYGVLMRYVFDIAFMEGPEAETFLLLMVFLTGLPYCTAKRNHIVLHIVYDRLPRRAQIICDLIAGLFGAIFFGLMAWRATAMVHDMYVYQEAGQFFQIPFWPMALVMFLCAATVALQFPLMAVQQALRGGRAIQRGHS